MLTITAIIRAKRGSEIAVRQALIDVADYVRANEPGTIGYFISQDPSDPCLFTTYERFTDKAAMDRHNNSEAVARFLDIAQPILDGDVTLIYAKEISAKNS
jgi:quinol monooxygenase YgiN